MATGDQADMLSRMKAVLPVGWFAGETPVLDALLSGPAWALALGYSLIAFARQQTRLRTASEGFLDLAAADFFGTRLRRGAGEADASLRGRILGELLAEKATRRGLIAALTRLTGRAPVVFEPARPADTGGYNQPVLAYATAGGYGSLQLPYQAFVTAYRPEGTGIPEVAGYGVPAAGYGVAAQGEYGDLAMVRGAVTDADINAAINATRPVGTVIWTCISNGPVPVYDTSDWDGNATQWVFTQ